MSHVVWLASFPKSGNTWLRSFLANYLTGAKEPFDINKLPSFSFGDMRVEFYQRLAGRPAAALTQADYNRLRPRVHRLFAEARDGPVFVKTHSALAMIGDVPTITPDVTFGALYVVRNPLDVAVSYSQHNAMSVDTAIDLLGRDSFMLPAGNGQVPQLIGDWSTHVRSWLTAPGLYIKVLRYEDMVANPTATFEGAVDFLKQPRDRKRLKRSVRNSAFKVLAAQETDEGFREGSPLSKRFFRSGKIGEWRNQLSPQQVERIIERHRSMMTELGYLSPTGAVLV
ncbi:MAG: sulfotransferase domain-containing protein [Rhodospirillales bacterium]|nr:sulfotransferase domain-containing protein [Rhodospirillales bacterium]